MPFSFPLPKYTVEILWNQSSEPSENSVERILQYFRKELHDHPCADSGNDRPLPGADNGTVEEDKGQKNG